MPERPFIPLAAPMIGAAERAAVDRVMRSGMLAQGPEVAAFEQEFSAVLVDRTPCVAVNSGTSGLHLALLAAGIGPGDEVIVPSFTFAATANAVALTGATPVFVDIDPATFTLDPAGVSEALTERTAAIMPVHLYGHPADLRSLSGIATGAGVLLGEDAAQAHGATYGGVAVGSFGAFGVFSLYPTKNMTAGEGGMVASADPELSHRLQMLRNQGMERPYVHALIGVNNRMSDLHAAIGRVQLTRLREWTAQRQANAAFLDDHLRGVVRPTVRPGCTHVYHQYTIRVAGACAAQRDAIVDVLRTQHQVGSGVYYRTPNHELAALAMFAPEHDLPHTRRAADEVISLPVHPGLSPDDLERVAEAVNTVVGGS